MNNIVPPIGIMPFKFWKEGQRIAQRQRAIELLAAMRRYSDAN